VTGLVSPFGFDAVQWKICVVTGWKMSSVMLVTVRTGFTPVQFGFGQPAVAPGTVGGVVEVAGFVVNVRFPFVTGRSSTGRSATSCRKARRNSGLHIVRSSMSGGSPVAGSITRAALASVYPLRLSDP
jgi:hypothetical protein